MGPITDRLVASALLLVASLAGTFEIKEHDDEGPITPEAESPKKLRLIVEAMDEGAHVAQVTTSIRSLRLRLTIRGNAKTAAGKKDPMKDAGELVEALLDETNLKAALDSVALGVRVMLAVRRPGVGTPKDGMNRFRVYEVECKAVRAELTV